jgi:hypothetical protein
MTRRQNMADHTCDPNTLEAKGEDHEFEACLGYIVRPFLKKKKVAEYNRV